MKIYFTSKRSNQLQQESFPQVAIFPDDDRWNDFGLRMYAKMRVFFSEKKSLDISIRLRIEGYDITSQWFDELDLKSETISNLSDMKLRFITAFVAAKSYVYLRKELGRERTFDLLTRLCDVPTLRSLDPTSEALKLTQDQNFELGFTRSDEAFRICNTKIDSLLDPLDSDPLEGLAATTFTFESQSGDVEFFFDCDESLLGKNRINVLIGANGVGKTSLLCDVARKISSKKERLHPVEPEQYVRETDDKIASVANLEAVEFSNVLFLTTTSLSAEIPSGVRVLRVGDQSNDLGKLSRALVKIAREVEDEGIEFFERLLKSAFGDVGFAVPMKDGSYRPLPSSIYSEKDYKFISNIDYDRAAVLLNSKGQRRFLSSGESVLLELVTYITAYAEPYSMVLVDEPENTLHPHFVSLLVENLRRICSSKKCFMLIATHSPLVVREISSDCVHIIKKENDKLQCLRPLMQTFGGSLSMITRYIFDDVSGDKPFQRAIQEALDTTTDIELFEQEVEKHFGTDALNYFSTAKRKNKNNLTKSDEK